MMLVLKASNYDFGEVVKDNQGLAEFKANGVLNHSGCIATIILLLANWRLAFSILTAALANSCSLPGSDCRSKPQHYGATLPITISRRMLE
jgi:hypothetical protein